MVDDEPSIVDAVATALRYEGYDVDEAANGRDALVAVAKSEPDLIVLDWMLPDLDGIEVGRRLREQGFKTAILFLTAKDSTENKVEALRAGGDDYVTKPFSLAEIVARTQAILRRSGGDLPGDVLRAGDLVLDEARHEVFRGETQVALTADRVRAAALLHAQPAPRPHQGPDPPERLALRLRRQRERGRDVRQLPAQEARRARAAADQDGAAGRLHARSRTAMSALSLRARLVLGVLVAAGIGLVVADVATYASLRSFLLTRVDRTLDDDHRGAGRLISRDDFEGGLGPGPRPRCFVQVRSSRGRCSTTSAVPHFPGAEEPSPPSLPDSIDVSDTPRPGGDRVVYFTVPATSGSERFRVRASIEPGRT